MTFNQKLHVMLFCKILTHIHLQYGVDAEFSKIRNLSNFHHLHDFHVHALVDVLDHYLLGVLSIIFTPQEHKNPNESLVGVHII